MKISIWQQFSSNHSNSFTVVGRFNTEDDARQAAKDLKHYLESTPSGVGPYHSELTPNKIIAGHKFGIAWTDHLDWIMSDGVEHVYQFGLYVAISSIVETSAGAKYVDQMMAQLSEEVFIEEEMGRNGLLVELKFQAPDEATAGMLYAAIHTYFLEGHQPNVYPNPPWWTEDAPYQTPEYDVYHGTIHRDGVKLWFTQLTFAAIGLGLPAMLAYLEDAGCTDIAYSIHERPYDEIYED